MRMSLRVGWAALSTPSWPPYLSPPTLQSPARPPRLQSRLVISRCFYHDLFSDAGQPQLAAACCCSLDRVWFETPFRGVAAGCTEAISAGDQRCCFTVRRQAPP
jgi:hypothetical protein